MTTLNINFDEVPDSLLVEPGVYAAQIVGVPSLEPTKDGTGQKVVVNCTITAGKYNGRGVRDFISTKMTTKLKRLAKAAGVAADAGGLDLAALDGKDVTIKVVNNPAQNDPTRIYANVDDYIPAA